MNQNNVLGLLSIGITVICWGAAFLLRDIILKQIQSASLVCLQSFLSALFIFLYLCIKKQWFKLEKKILLTLLFSGVLGIACYQSACNIGISLVGSTIASVFVGLTPFGCLLAEIIFYKRKPTKAALFSVLLSFLGITALVYQKNTQAHFQFLGYGMLLLSLGAWIGYCFISKNIPSEINGYVILFYQLSAAAIVTLPFLFCYPVSFKILFQKEILLSLLALSFVNGIIAYLFFLYALKRIGVIITNAVTNVVPVVTLALNFFIYHIKISFFQFIGILFVLGAVFILERENNSMQL